MWASVGQIFTNSCRRACLFALSQVGYCCCCFYCSSAITWCRSYLAALYRKHSNQKRGATFANYGSFYLFPLLFCHLKLVRWASLAVSLVENLSLGQTLTQTIRCWEDHLWLSTTVVRRKRDHKRANTRGPCDCLKTCYRLLGIYSVEYGML